MPQSPDHQHDLFISYADADRSWVEGYLLKALKAAGVDVHSETDFVPGVPSLAQFEQAVKTSSRTLLVLTPAYMADQVGSFVDLLALSYGVETDTWPVIPLLLQPVELPTRLTILHSLDATDSADWEEVIARLCAELKAPLPGAAVDHLRAQPWSPIKVALPPEMVQPPDVTKFVGRQEELAYFVESIKNDHVAVIAGIAGVGKTAFASKLAQQIATAPDKIFWHQFHAGEGIEAVVWRLAGMLYRHGRTSLWESLEGARQSGGQPPPPEILLDYLVQLLRGQRYVLCLDDFQYVEDDPLVEKAVEKLQPLLQTGDINLIVTSRRIPEIVKTWSFKPFAGLSLIDAGALLSALRVALSADLLADLHRRTDGNAELLILATHALHRSRSPEKIVQRLVDEDDIETFLLKEIDKSLNDDERLVMSGVAALLGYPGTRSAIEVTLASGSLKRTLRYLANRFLLREQEGRFDGEYLAHVIVQEFYYDSLGPKDRKEMHRRAGEFYECEEPDLLRSAMHYQRAGELVRAAELATADVWAAINQGQVRQLRSLLEMLARQTREDEPAISVQLALGEILAFLGESESARVGFEAALAQLARLPSTHRHKQSEVRAFLGMGTVLESQAPDDALHWLEQGLAAAGSDETAARAALHSRIGSVRIGLTEYDMAIASLHQALALLSGSPSQLRVNVLINLGTAYSASGDSSMGSQFTAQALEMSRELHDLYGILGILSNIGIDKEIGGDWSGASVEYWEALKLAEQLGSLAEQARIHNLLGTLRLHQGDGEAAEGHLLRATAIARQINNPEFLAATLPVLAQLYLQRQDREAARAALTEAEALATERGWDYVLPETYATQAHLVVADGEFQLAEDYAERSIAIAIGLGQVVDAAKGWRAKGQVLTAAEQIDAALSAFEQSMKLLADQDPYEVAQTQIHFAQALSISGNHDGSLDLLNQANAQLEKLGVKPSSY